MTDPLRTLALVSAALLVVGVTAASAAVVWLWRDRRRTCY